MLQIRKYHVTKVLMLLLWIALGTGILVITASAIGNKNEGRIDNISIIINGAQDQRFIDQKEIIQLLEKASGKSLKNQSIGTLDLTTLETQLQKNPWIQRAELFFDNSNTLQVKIQEATPVARVYDVSGRSFYISAQAGMLPLSDRLSARLPVFTGFPATVKAKEDSALVQEIITLSDFIANDPFWMSQIDQTDITPDRTFEMIPKLGNQVIRFGTVENYQEKFRKLLAFYRQVQTKTGWNKYSIIDLQFDRQVVAVKRNAAEIKADSIAAIRIMKQIIEQAKINSADSSQIQMPSKEEAPVVMPPQRPKAEPKTVELPEQQPVVSDNPPILVNKPVEKNVKKEKVKEPLKKKEIKKENKEPEKKEERVPKAVMPAKQTPENDY